MTLSKESNVLKRFETSTERERKTYILQIYRRLHEFIHENVDLMTIRAYLGGSDKVQLGCRRERRHGEEHSSLTLSAILSAFYCGSNAVCVCYFSAGRRPRGGSTSSLACSGVPI
jgi:transcriptional regulator of acetoin/glycerol metabolism